MAVFAEAMEDDFVKGRNPLSKAIIWSILRDY